MIDKLIADDVKKKIVRDLTSFFLHKHYCENDDEALIAYFEAPSAGSAQRNTNTRQISKQRRIRSGSLQARFHSVIFRTNTMTYFWSRRMFFSVPGDCG